MSERILISSGSPYENTVGFSRVVRVDDRVFVAGTAPIWPDDFVDPDPGVQAARCFEIIGQALEDAGARFEDVVRTRIYLVDAAHQEAVGIEHGKVFSEIRPAATMVVAGGLLDPRWLVEIEVEAVIG